MLERQADARHLNGIFNDESVLPYVVFDGIDSIDLSEVIADEANYALATEHGGFIFYRQQPAISPADAATAARPPHQHLDKL